MYQKQNILFFDGVVIMLAASLLFAAWSVSRSLALVQPSATSTAQPAPLAQEVTVPDFPTPAILTDELTNVFRVELKNTLSEFATSQPNNTAVVVHELTSDVVVSHNAKQSVVSASLYKPFAAIAALKLVDNGQLSLDSVLAETDGRNVRQCVIDTISVSDNPCGHSLLSTASLTVPQLRADGYSGTDLSGLYPVTTAADVTKLFEQIYKGKLLSKASHQLLLGALKDQKINDRLPTGLPKGAAAAHKTGDLEGYAHDAGVIYGPNGDYIITILSEPDTSGRNLVERYVSMGQLSAKVYKLINQFQTELAAISSS